MRRSSILLLVALLVACLTVVAVAQDKIITPPSTRGLPNLNVRTPLYVVQPETGVKPDAPPARAENPGSLACIYGVTAPTTGCPRVGSPVATGGSKAIAVVDYGHNSTLQSDFNTFNTQYGLPAQTLTFQCACGSCPSNDGSGWDVESALDVEYAHAMAPQAQIIVSEFCSDPIGDGGITSTANFIVANYGAGEMSNSWTYNGGESWCGANGCELSYDHYFSVAGIVFFGSAGDGGLGPAYPSISPNVVSAGGTTITRDGNGNFTGETCWSGSGGGISNQEPLPQYQLILANKLGTKRGTPDWAGDASPNSGAAVYSTTGCGGWCQVGGTSLSSPMLAGILNSAGTFGNHTVNDLGKTYQYYRNPGKYRHYFYDVISGSNGSPAAVGWDQCTGLGTPRTPSGF
jgi:subtilase family serine protease